MFCRYASYSSYDQTAHEPASEPVAAVTEPYQQEEYSQQPVSDWNQQPGPGHDQGYSDQPQLQDPASVPDLGPSIQDQPPIEAAVEPVTSTAPPTFFNPGEVTSSSGAPTFFNPASLPSIPEQAARKGSLSRQGSVNQTPSRKTSEARSRQASESKDAPPPMVNSYYGSIGSSAPPPQPTQAPEPVSSQQPPEQKKPAPKKEVKKKDKQDEGKKKSSMFGGILSKFWKNDQAILPDDKDNRIIFDEAKGRWVNLDEDEDEAGPAAPPPMDPAFSAASTAPAAGPGGPGGPGGPPAAPTSFRAGLTSRRGGRGYVDVLGQSGMSKPVSSPAMMPNGAPPVSPAAPGMAPPPAMFNPGAPVSAQGAPGSLTHPAGGDQSEESGPASMPMMFNPSSMGASAMPPNF